MASVANAKAVFFDILVQYWAGDTIPKPAMCTPASFFRCQVNILSTNPMTLAYSYDILSGYCDHILSTQQRIRVVRIRYIVDTRFCSFS